MKKHRIVVITAILLAALGTNTKADEGLSTGEKFETEFVWDGLVSYVCMVQDEKFKSSWYGQQLIDDGGFDEWKDALSSKTLSCIKQKQILPKKLCADMFTIKADTGADYLDTVYAKNKAVIDHLDVLNKCE